MMPAAVSKKVLGTFESGAAARSAITAVGRTGIDGVKIAVRRSDGFEHTGLAAGRRRRADARLVRWAVWRAAVPASIGVVIGGGLAAAGSELAGGTPAVVLAAAVIGAVVGGTVGFLVGGIASLGLSEDWEATFDDTGGPFTVVVRAVDEDEAEGARQALEAAGARRVTCEDAGSDDQAAPGR